MFQSVTKVELFPAQPHFKPSTWSTRILGAQFGAMQTTLASSVSFSGIGLHTGKPVRITFHPTQDAIGIRFVRTDVTRKNPVVMAKWHAVCPSELCTRLTNSDGVTVSTVEHVLAAMAGCGVHNLTIEIDGPEVPILDGSAAPFVSSILAVGLRQIQEPLFAIEVTRAVEVSVGQAFARLEPCDALELSFQINFSDRAIGDQQKSLRLMNGAFVHELSDSRTFCSQNDVDAMHARGLALGGTLENAVVFDGPDVLSPGGLRHHDEAVRHKMLDALGDLALAGAPLLARYTGCRAGHALTNSLLRVLFAQPQAFRFVDVTDAIGARLPGAGVQSPDVPHAVVASHDA